MSTGMNIDFKRKLEIPQEVKKKFPLKPKLAEIVEKREQELKNILSGKDDRLVLIIGPCSADDETSMIDYAVRLKELSDKTKDKLFIIPRVYTSKPRTTGKGYKGLLHQPNSAEEPDMYNGIISVRSLHMKVLEETGLSTADEMLYTEELKYVDDLLGYVAVGARSVENQQHRLTASGITIPVGMKNPTSGDFGVMLNAITAAQSKHTFIYRGWEGTSKGNPYAHAILRGYTNKHGSSLPNYHYEDLMLVNELYNKGDYTNKAVIIDCNHANSNKQPLEQPRIIEEIMKSREYNKDIKNLVKGFMVESYIEDGAQKIGDNIYGKSITDPCIGWKGTEELIYALSQQL